MAADIVEGTQDAIATANHEDPLAHEIARQIVAGFGNVAHVAHQEPLAAKDGLFLEFEELGVVVDPGRLGVEIVGFPGRGVFRLWGWLGRGPLARKLGWKYAPEKTTASGPGTLEVEGILAPQLGFGERREHVMEGPAQGLGFEVRVAALRRDGGKYLHPLFLEFGFPGRAHPHVVFPGAGFAPERGPNRHPVGMAEFRVEGSVDHGLEAGHRGIRMGEHRLALAKHVLAIHVLEGGQQQPALALKIEIHDPRGQPGSLGDAGHGGPRKTVLGNALNGGIDELLATPRVPGCGRGFGNGFGGGRTGGHGVGSMQRGLAAGRHVSQTGGPLGAPNVLQNEPRSNIEYWFNT